MEVDILMIKNDFSRNEYLDFVEDQWESYFLKKGYIQETPVKITSRVDSSVELVGSTTSPLKKYVLNDNIGKTGRFIIQNCIRTQGLKNPKKSESSNIWIIFQAHGNFSRAFATKFRKNSF